MSSSESFGVQARTCAARRISRTTFWSAIRYCSGSSGEIFRSDRKPSRPLMAAAGVLTSRDREPARRP
jgi:hypothetical protein